ncbi:hypothetical protein LguiB_030088 [Lonicera macranthoides]
MAIQWPWMLLVQMRDLFRAPPAVEAAAVGLTTDDSSSSSSTQFHGGRIPSPFHLTEGTLKSDPSVEMARLRAIAAMVSVLFHLDLELEKKGPQQQD